MRLHQKIAVAVAVVLIAVGVYVDAVFLPDAEPKPGPTVDGIASERAAGKRTLQRNFEQIEKAIPELDRSAEAFANGCYEGQQNYKVDEGFAYKCTYKITRFYGSNQPIDELNEQLFSALEFNNFRTPSENYIFDRYFRRGNLEFYCEYADKNNKSIDSYVQSLSGEYSEVEDHFMEKNININDRTRDILSSHRYALVVSIEVDYYQK